MAKWADLLYLYKFPGLSATQVLHKKCYTNMIYLNLHKNDTSWLSMKGVLANTIHKTFLQPKKIWPVYLAYCFVKKDPMYEYIWLPF